ncbi:hypothetical protein K466DRAFT_563163 [Polyporus arcularius HHB13444]|uniref:F-box domain-containing protein n=1 Tax=Polyporus arcularius HHB13444 TaxID=1314778 RepID=A0A5C3PY75_9APHY|nr:hypothetical protein K466DRAFT_563163 [Polyporus arcularius HHB13444]
MPPTLNYDVLLHVLLLCDSVVTATSLMATCKLLYREGIRIVLGKQITIIKKERTLVSFMAYVRAITRIGTISFPALRYMHTMPKLSRLTIVGPLFFKHDPSLLPPEGRTHSTGPSARGTLVASRRIEHDGDSEQPHLLRDMLMRPRPVSLTFRLRGASFLDDVKTLCVVDKGIAVLTHLELNMSVTRRGDRDVDFGRAMRAMEAWLLSIDQPARLKIVVEMHTDNGGGRAQESTSCWHERAGCSKRCIAREQRPWFSKLEQGMEAFDVRRYNWGRTEGDHVLLQHLKSNIDTLVDITRSSMRGPRSFAFLLTTDVRRVPLVQQPVDCLRRGVTRR